MWHNINMLIVMLNGGTDKYILGSGNKFLMYNKQILTHFVNKNPLFFRC